MTLKVELGFTDVGASAPFLTLDDPIKGRLDDIRWVLGGGQGLVDVTAYVRTASWNRGKSRDLGRYEPGSANVTFNNDNRYFDPTYTESPFFGQLVPKRKMVITYNDVVQFTGTTEDWNIDYDLSGMSVASCSASDGLATLANLTFTDYLPDEELSGARINSALDNIGWSATEREIDAGQAFIVDQIVEDSTNALAYLTNVASSEPGQLFCKKNGDIRFIARDSGANSSGVTFGGDSGIGISAIEVVYGSELLYNRFVVTNQSAEYVAEDAQSIETYGARDISIDTYLSNDDDLEPYANVLLAQYKNPEYRFDSVTVILNGLSEAERDALATIELGQYTTVRFTPSGIPPEIVRYGKIIRIEANHTPNMATMTFGLQTFANPVFILDDPLLGKLDTGVLGY